MNILVVDDEPVIRELFKRSLGENQHNVTACASGVEALETINGNGFDLIFLDLMLLDLTGVEIIKYIRRKDRKIPVVIITGLYESKLVNEVMTYNPFLILKKPFILITINSIVSILSNGQKTKAEALQN